MIGTLFIYNLNITSGFFDSLEAFSSSFALVFLMTIKHVRQICVMSKLCTDHADIQTSSLQCDTGDVNLCKNLMHTSVTSMHQITIQTYM